MSLFVLVVLCGFALGAELELAEKADQNVVATQLVGNWSVDSKLSQRFSGKKENEFRLEGVAGNVTTIRFEEDFEVLELLPEKFRGAIVQRKWPIYLAGRFEVEEVKYPFLLTNVHGNPHVLFFRERDDGTLDGESFNVMLARGKEAADDLLFIGGDFNNSHFAAYKRTAGDDVGVDEAAPLKRSVGEIIVSIGADGSLEVEGKKKTPQDLLEVLSGIAKENKDQAVILRGHHDTPFDKVVNVLNVCQKAGIWNVSFAMPPKE